MPSASKTDDPYLYHRRALQPLLDGTGASGGTVEAEIDPRIDEETFVKFILQQGLGAMWDAKLEDGSVTYPFSDRSREKLHHFRLQATGHYMVQRNNMEQIKSMLDAKGIEHVVIKGCHTREVYYDTPSLRPAEDIDILIRPADKVQTIKTFQNNGYSFYGTPENIAQDCSLIKGKTVVDLHWDILRPGRTRIPMVDTLVERRTDCSSHWGMDHASTLFLALVHPVFRKYTTTPHASLMRLVDLQSLLVQHPDCIDQTHHLLESAGLKTAGWITSRWLKLMTDGQHTIELSEPLSPGKIRRRYLDHWLGTDRSTRHVDRPLIIQLGFTLPAHDSFRDALRAGTRARQLSRQGERHLKVLEDQVGAL